MDNMKRNQLLCGAAGIVIGVLLFFSQNAGSLSPVRVLERNTYGGGGVRQELIVKGVNRKSESISIDLDELAYDSEMAGKVFGIIKEQLPQMILGENESASHVDSPLYLPSKYPDSGVSLEWRSSDKRIIDASGEIHEASPEGSSVIIEADIIAGDYSDSVSYEFTIYPTEDTDEKRIKRLTEWLAVMQFGSMDSQTMELPDEFEGRKISFSRKLEMGWMLFPIMGVVFGLLLPLNEKQKAKDEKKKYEMVMMLDYADIISKLVIFTGAGMSMRMAWEKVVSDYEMSKKSAGEGKGAWTDKPAYEEMAYAVRRMHRGVPEITVYNEFGERCRAREYRKLSSLLVQSLKNGSKGLKEALDNEMESAFEAQKNLARRLGEEASTKLLAPLMMLLAIVMMVVIVPAFMSFSQ